MLGAEPAEALLRRAYGYEPWLLAPDKGVRALIGAALELFRPPTLAAVGGVHAALAAAVDAAAERSLDGAPDWQRAQLAGAALACVGAWREAAERQLGLLLEAEQAAPEGDAFAAVRARLASLAAMPGGLAAATWAASAQRKESAQEAAAPKELNTLFGRLQRGGGAQPPTPCDTSDACCTCT